ncbi:MAG: MFS transporter [Desulfomonile tiedjei]|nr:MFS transporter [Desulfomonile tiedjei]
MGDHALRRAVLFVAITSSLLTPLMLSAVTVALPEIQKEFQLDAVLLTWISTAYLLSASVFLVPFGKASDIIGRKKVYVTGMAVFTLSSFLCTLSVNVQMLICFRILQGMGISMVLATGMAILTSVFPPSERGKAIGWTVAAVYIGLSAGPFLGGILTHSYGWRSIFGVMVPLGMLTTYTAATKLTADWADAKSEKIDLVGSLLYAIAITAIMIGLSGLPSAMSLGLLSAGIATMVIFFLWELRARFPVISIRLFTMNRVFAFSSLAALINYSATFAIAFVLSLYLQYIKGYDPRTAGLVLVAQPLTMAAFSPIAGKLSDRIEPQKLASAGMGITAVGLLGLAFLGFGTSVTFIVSDLLVIGFGFALFSSPNMNAIMGSVERQSYGVASGVVGSMRLLGQMLSMGIATLVFSLTMGRAQITPSLYPAFLESVDAVFTICAVLCILGVFASLARGKMRDNIEK